MGVGSVKGKIVNHPVCGSINVYCLLLQCPFALAIACAKVKSPRSMCLLGMMLAVVRGMISCTHTSLCPTSPTLCVTLCCHKLQSCNYLCFAANSAGNLGSFAMQKICQAWKEIYLIPFSLSIENKTLYSGSYSDIFISKTPKFSSKEWTINGGNLNSFPFVQHHQ